MISVGGSSVGETLGFLALAILFVAAIAFWVIARGRRRGSRTIALDTTFTLSSWITGLGAIFGIIRLGAALVNERATITTSHVSLNSADALPCGHFVEGDRTGSGPWVDCIASSTTRVDIDGIALGARALLAVGEFLTTIAVLTPFALVAVVCFETIRGRTFGRTVIRSLWIAAGVILATGTLGSIVSPFGEYLALSSVNLTQSVQVSLTLFPLGGALLCAAFAAIFRHGSRLQSDTEGLV
ncbi:hypothetical protein GCM10010922_11830 [Microbacterium sorbitolivorans]|uniref:DUF2975 domain-containing protein n=1 Tax=Microbacterium sorbitolivorans TaxID=1867410 RepID=A0A367Y0T7_9MICO|nr:hypothetical protein [Microbacterium sorbitolivorans]RCK58641.1 hypothetical protein DTO57_10835 [Microbacterium sorbitolivorans]GGF38143.1 hypothetical protein GCM10010922_11830 [Microbacterium sorbitolivorans]